MFAEKVVEGKNVEEAVKEASIKLGIDVEKLKYEVVSYGSTGIFGLVGVKKAKIKIILPEEKSKIKEEILEIKTDKQREEIKIYEPKEIIKKDQTIYIEEQQRKKEEENGLKNSESEERDYKPLPSMPEELMVFQNNPKEIGRVVIQRILEKITIDTNIEIIEEGDCLIYNVTGGKAAVLIGKRGQTLEAIQYIIEKIVNRVSEKRLRVKIDVQGYLKNRNDNLIELANRLAEKANRIGKPVTVGEMNVYDRKIIHMALKDHRNVRTQSMGNGFYRKLMIFPKKNGLKKDKNIKIEEKDIK